MHSWQVSLAEEKSYLANVLEVFSGRSWDILYNSRMSSAYKWNIVKHAQLRGGRGEAGNSRKAASDRRTNRLRCVVQECS